MTLSVTSQGVPQHNLHHEVGVSVNLDQKLDILVPAATYDACDTHAVSGRRYTSKRATWRDTPIGSETLADGKRRPVVQLLQSAECVFNCPYCPLRADRDIPRATLNAEEVAAAAAPQLKHHDAGLLLSSAVVGSPDQAASALVDGAHILRTRHQFAGYVHLKLPPGVSHAVIEAAARVADRLSLNMEVPSAAHQERLDASRDWRKDVVARLAWMRDFRQAGLLKAGIATQFVVGAAGESDRDLVLATQWLHQELAVSRVYYAAFQPIVDTPLAGLARTPAVRGQRLLQADWLLRHYHFRAEELAFDAGHNFVLAHDPKLAWALQHPERFPVEINTASYEGLLRVPGLGPLSAKRIMRLRVLGRLREPSHIAVLGAAATRIVDFVTFDGRFFGTGASYKKARRDALNPIAEQLKMW